MAKLESKLSVKNEQLKQNQQKIMKLKKKMENYKFKFTLAELEKTQFQFQYRIKFTEAELEKIQFQSQIALLEQRAGSSKPTQVEGQPGPTGGNLLQDMMDNFRELAETHLQCVVCSELFVDAVSINCGHTFVASVSVSGGRRRITVRCVEPILEQLTSSRSWMNTQIKFLSNLFWKELRKPEQP